MLDPLNPGRSHRGTELLITQHGEALLEAELEPVTAGNPVARPVVKIFMADHAFNIAVVLVSGNLWPGQHVLGVEDVEALVLHRTHVEIADSNDVIDIEVVFAVVGLFIPAHRALQGGHRVRGFTGVIGAGQYLQFYRPAAAGGKAVDVSNQVARHQRKQVGWLGEGVVPDRKMIVALLAALHQVAI